jgi:hypothetical protein
MSLGSTSRAAINLSTSAELLPPPATAKQKALSEKHRSLCPFVCLRIALTMSKHAPDEFCGLQGLYLEPNHAIVLMA